MHLLHRLAFTAVLFALIGTTHAQPFRAGGAEVDITPEPGASHYRGVSKGAHDPLFARALYFEQGDVKAALIVLDVLTVSVNLTIPARQAISQWLDIPYANISITATHTHAGPRDHNAPKDDANAYAKRVRDAIVQAVRQAQSNAQPVAIRHGSVSQSPTVSFNRRFHMKDGSVRMNPGLRNPNIVRPEGPIDPEIGIVLFQPKDGTAPAASLINFALHLDTVGGNLYSVDYPLYVHRALRSQFGAEHRSVFGTGTCGDINHLDVKAPGPQRGHREGHQTTQTIGRALAASVMSTLPKLQTSTGSLAVRHAVLQAPLQTLTPEQMAWARGEVDGNPVKERAFLIARRRAKLLSLDRLHQKWGPAIPLDVHAIRLGPQTAVVTLPGEVFVELGLAIKKASPFETTLVIELANDSIAYVPTKNGFSNGDYEAVNSRIQPGWGEKMAERAIQLLQELKP